MDLRTCLCVTRDERWGRSYESYGEDPALVTALAGVSITGLQGNDPTDISGPNEVLATAKYWVGDGGTTYNPALAGSGYPIDQGITNVASEAELEQLFVDPYRPAIEAGVGTIMPSYSAVSIAGADPVRMHENTDLNTDLLKNELGFKGFLISDWEGIDKLSGDSYADKAVRAVNSGLDMAMAPYNYEAFITAVIGAAGPGIPQTRIDDAVRRILNEKFEAGLFDHPFAGRSHIDDFGSDDHRDIARQAAAESQVLLKNDGVLPLSSSATVTITGSNANNLGHQMGWLVDFLAGRIREHHNRNHHRAGHHRCRDQRWRPGGGRRRDRRGHQHRRGGRKAIRRGRWGCRNQWLQHATELVGSGCDRCRLPR